MKDLILKRNWRDWANSCHNLSLFKMKTILQLSIAVLLLLGALACTPELQTTPTDHPFKIGVILSLQGDGALYGQDAQKALQEAYNTLTPGEQDNIKLIIESITAFSATEAVTAYHKLHDADDVNALIVWGSGPSKAVSPLSNADKVPLIAIASAKQVTNGTTFSFRHYGDAARTAQFTFDAIKKKGFNNFGFLTADYPSKVEMCGALKELVKQDSSLHIAYDEKIDPKERDLSTYVTKIKSASVETPILCLQAGQFIPFGKRAEEQKYYPKNPAQIGLGDLTSEMTNTTVPTFFSNSFYAEPCVDDQKEKQFLTLYGKKPSQGTYNTYDALMLFVEAYRNKQKTPDQIRTYLFSLKNYPGTTGTYSSDENYGFTIPLRMQILTNGQFLTDRDLSQCI